MTASTAGYPALARAGKATVQRILAGQMLQPHKVRYYLEHRDPDFERKMREVLLVYQKVTLQNEAGNVSDQAVITVSVDEKPGVQAIGNTAVDLPPVLESTQPSPATMNTSATALGPFLPPWIFGMVTSQHALRRSTEVLERN